MSGKVQICQRWVTGRGGGHSTFEICWYHKRLKIFAFKMLDDAHRSLNIVNVWSPPLSRAGEPERETSRRVHSQDITGLIVWTRDADRPSLVWKHLDFQKEVYLRPCSCIPKKSFPLYIIISAIFFFRNGKPISFRVNDNWKTIHKAMIQICWPEGWTPLKHFSNASIRKTMCFFTSLLYASNFTLFAANSSSVSLSAFLFVAESVDFARATCVSTTSFHACRSRDIPLPIWKLSITSWPNLPTQDWTLAKAGEQFSNSPNFLWFLLLPGLLCSLQALWLFLLLAGYSLPCYLSSQQENVLSEFAPTTCSTSNPWIESRPSCVVSPWQRQFAFSSRNQSTRPQISNVQFWVESTLQLPFTRVTVSTKLGKWGVRLERDVFDPDDRDEISPKLWLETGFKSQRCERFYGSEKEPVCCLKFHTRNDGKRSRTKTARSSYDTTEVFCLSHSVRTETAVFQIPWTIHTQGCDKCGCKRCLIWATSEQVQMVGPCDKATPVDFHCCDFELFAFQNSNSIWKWNCTVAILDCCIQQNCWFTQDTLTVLWVGQGVSLLVCTVVPNYNIAFQFRANLGDNRYKIPISLLLRIQHTLVFITVL